MQKQVVLEKSTNTHVTSSNVQVVSEIPTMTTMVLQVPEGQMVVEHGHHHTVATDLGTKNVIKITQQEFNPVLKAFQNSFD